MRLCTDCQTLAPHVGEISTRPAGGSVDRIIESHQTWLLRISRVSFRKKTFRLFVPEPNEPEICVGSTKPKRTDVTDMKHACAAFRSAPPAETCRQRTNQNAAHHSIHIQEHRTKKPPSGLQCGSKSMEKVSSFKDPRHGDDGRHGSSQR